MTDYRSWYEVSETGLVCLWPEWVLQWVSGVGVSVGIGSGCFSWGPGVSVGTGVAVGTGVNVGSRRVSRSMEWA